MPNAVDVEIRVMRVGDVVISHHLAVPDLAYAHAECEMFVSMMGEIDRPSAVLMVLDRVLPPASAKVVQVYRESAGRTSVGVWAAVVGGVMGFAASIATSMATRVFADRPVPMRVLRTVPAAIAWMGEVMDLRATPAELLASIEHLRSPAFIREVRRVG